METILSIEQLSKHYGRVKALNNVSFTIEKGNIYGILGPNGSGKSTTLGIVLNVVNASSGGFKWFSGTISTHEALKKVGAIIERPNFYPYMTAWENLELVCKIKGVPYTKIEEKLAIVGLLERKDSKFKTFSLGMKQRLAIASAIVNDPEILILDEPTNGLDPMGIRQIRDIIKQIAAQGTTILLASHLLDEVEKVCSHVVVLQNGVMRYSGRVEDMFSEDGYYELQAPDNEALMTILKSHEAVKLVEFIEGKVRLYLQLPWKPADINQYLFERGLVLEHLVKRNVSLEDQFLKLIKSTQS